MKYANSLLQLIVHKKKKKSDFQKKLRIEI